MIVRGARPKESPYIEWAKAHGKVAYNLAVSGVPPCGIELLAPSVDDFTMSADNEYGWVPLVERIASRYEVDASCVVLAHGTSMANHIACAAVLEPGDEVLLELPVYDPLRIVPEYLGCAVHFFERRAADGYRVHADSVERALTPGVRLVIISNLHNPTGALVTRAELEELASLAEEHDFYVLVDEVYLEWLYDAGDEARSAINLSPRFIATRSLTKAYGFAALRAGWVLAEPELAARMRKLNALFTNSMAHPTERLAARALDHAAALLGEQRVRVNRNREQVAQFIDAEPRLSWVPPRAGTVGFVRLDGGDVDGFVKRLLAEYDTLVVPGRFFGAADHFRIGFGMHQAQLTEGLQRLSSALGR